MSKFERIEGTFDPERCQASDPVNGTCPYKATEGSTYCARHGGHSVLAARARQGERMYLLGKWQDRVQQLAEHASLKDLSNELGIMRMMLEEILNQCEDAQDLLLHSARITGTVDKIQRLVETLDRIESRNAIAPTELVGLAAKWVQIINVHVNDPALLEKLSDELLDTIEAS